MISLCVYGIDRLINKIFDQDRDENELAYLCTGLVDIIVTLGALIVASLILANVISLDPTLSIAIGTTMIVVPLICFGIYLWMVFDNCNRSAGNYSRDEDYVSYTPTRKETTAAPIAHDIRNKWKGIGSDSSESSKH